MKNILVILTAVIGVFVLLLLLVALGMMSMHGTMGGRMGGMMGGMGAWGLLWTFLLLVLLIVGAALLFQRTMRR